VRSLGLRVARDVLGQLGGTLEQAQEGLLTRILELAAVTDDRPGMSEQHPLVPTGAHTKAKSRNL
jgi:hypothetical protein